MKFVISKDLEHSKLLNTLMMGVSIALFFYLIFDVILHGFLIGSNISAISNTLYGNLEEFIEPILLDTLLLQVHIDLFMSLFTLMILSTIYIRFFSEEKATKWLIHLLFILGLAAPLMLLGAYMNSLLFVYLWIFTFMAGHLLAIFFALRIVKRVFVI
jgi:hypothetical protein